MRRDTEIGVIVGIVLAIIIGVFISTRTVVKEPSLPLSHTYEGKNAGEDVRDLGVGTQQPLPEIAELPEERQASIQKEEGEEELEEEVVEGEWEEIEPPPATVAKETKPATQPAPAKESDVAIHKGKDVIHKVKPNDTLTKLAKQYYGNEAKWTLIYDANAGKLSHRNALYVGQEIVIPAVSGAAEKPAVVEHLPSPPSQEVTALKEAGKRTHTIQKGDTLFKLARQYYNNEAEWKKIYDANKNVIPNPNDISQGTVLIIPE